MTTMSAASIVALEHAVVSGAGTVADMPMDVYHAMNAASNSRLSKILRSPAHLKAYLDAPRQDTIAQKIGRAVHIAILEPDSFASTFTVAEQCSATKKGDGLRCTFPGVAFHAGLGWLCGIHVKGAPGAIDDSRIVLSPTDYATCLAVRDSVRRHPAARALLEALTAIELSVFWVDAETGVPCKARFDGFAPFAGGTIIDIKSCVDASRREFERTIFTRGYHRQGAFYLDGGTAAALHAAHFVNIAVEKEPPYAVAVYRPLESAIDAGREQLRPALRLYAECERTQLWPAYSDDVQDIALPDWSWKQIDQQIMEATP